LLSDSLLFPSFEDAKMATTGAEKTAEQHIEDAIHHHEPQHHAPVATITLHHDAVAPEAIGGFYDELPPGYYQTMEFIGTVTVSLYQILISWRSSLTSEIGYMSCSNQRISWLGFAIQHIAINQRCSRR
jgi:hypothetical protein